MAQLALLVVVLVVASCAAESAPIPDWRTDPNEPYPFTTRVPPRAPTALDGVYDRPPTDHFKGEWARCTRCPPYFVDRGRSVLALERGRWRNVHQQPTQVTAGHFTVSGDRITFFNDPICPRERGEYRFNLDGAVLRLEVVNDSCAFGERERDLTDEPWIRLAEPGAQISPR